MATWNAGDTIIFRYIAHDDTIAQAIPTRVIEHSDDLLALHIADGTMMKSVPDIPSEERASSLASRLPAAERPKLDRRWSNDTIRLHFPGEPFSIWLLFGPDWKFNWWYGNLESPYVETEFGIDTRDHALDVAARPDGRWWWKDEEEFEERLALGLDSARHQATVRAAGLEVIRRLEEHEFPFGSERPEWRPDADIPLPALPPDWDRDFGTQERLPRTDAP
jgi:hypothetical protein